MVMRHIILLLALLCVSCGTSLSSFKPYRMDVQQGNVVTSKMMLQLRPGMTRSQVRFIMGSPLIQDRFHGNRWDYFYQMRKDGKVIEQRRVILEFENDALVRVRGDVIPLDSGQHELASPATTPESESRNSAAKAKKDEKGLTEKLKFWKSDEKQPDAGAATPAKQEAAPVAGAASVEDKDAKQQQDVKQEKGLLDKLKFWQSDDDGKPAAEKAVVPPLPVEAAPAVAPALPAKTEAVPAESSRESSSDEKAPAKAPVSSEGTQPMETPEPVAAPRELPAETRSEPAPVTPLVSEPSGEPVELMMDYELNLPSDPGNPSNVSNPSSAPPSDLPPEASPEFFERMLEKIGF